MDALDLFTDEGFPHSTKAGYDRGCRGSYCPGEISCRDAAVRYRGDFTFRRLMDAGWSGDRIVTHERSEAAAVEQARKDAAERARTDARRLRDQERAEEKRAAHAAARKARPVEKKRSQAPVRVSSAVLLREEKFAELDRWEAERDRLTGEVAAAVAAVQAARDAVTAHAATKPKWRRRTVAAKPTRSPRLVQGHGTNAAYARGCRCDECKEAARAYGRAYPARRAENGGAGLRWGTLRHGTASGYQLGCRSRETCPGNEAGVTCLDASNAADAERRRRRGAPERVFVPAEPVREHVRTLNRSGVPYLTIAERAGVHASVVKNLLYGRSPASGGHRQGNHQEGILRENAEKLLAVTA